MVKARCPYCEVWSAVVYDDDPTIGWQWEAMTLGCPHCQTYQVLNEIGRTVRFEDRAAFAEGVVIKAARRLFVDNHSRGTHENAYEDLREAVEALLAAEGE